MELERVKIMLLEFLLAKLRYTLVVEAMNGATGETVV